MGNQQSSSGATDPRAHPSPQYLVNLTASASHTDDSPFEAWDVKVEVGGYQTAIRSIQDPFEPAEEEIIRWHVEDYARTTPYEKSKALLASQLLLRYSRALLKQLQLQEIIEINPFSCYIFDIRATENAFSFHKLHWEVLENIEMWPESDVRPASVMIRRTLPCVLEPLKISKAKKRVLIISSRPEGDRDIPRLLLSAPVIRLLEDFRKKEQDFGVVVEVVRPDTWEAVKTLVERHEWGYFNLVHFDMHGCVQGGEAYLKFALSPATQSARLVTSAEVGTLLGSKGVHSVLLNACESAKSTANPSENFAAGLLQSGISEVVAMAYLTSSSAAVKFVVSFYESYFVSDLSFTESAFFARKALASSKIRHARFGEEVAVDDFFIPISFSTETLGLTKTLVAIEKKGGASTEESIWARFGARFLEPVKPYLSTQYYDINLNSHHEDINTIEGYFLPRMDPDDLSKNMIVIHGMAGIGKSRFAANICWWWGVSAFVQRVIKLSISCTPFTRALTSFHDSLKSKFDAPDIGSVVEQLRETRHVLLIDNLDRGTQGSRSDLESFNAGEREVLKSFLQSLEGGASLIVITSRSMEEWLEIPARRHHLTGLQDDESRFALINSRMREMGLSKPQGSDIRTFQNISDTLCDNPSAIEILLSGIDTSAGSKAAAKLLNDLRGGFIDNPTTKIFSKQFVGILRCEPYLSVKHVLDQGTKGDPATEFLVMSLAVLSERVCQDWFEFIISKLGQIQKATGQSVELLHNIVPEAQLSVSEFRLILNEKFLDKGLLRVHSHFNQYYEINPLFTYAIRDKIKQHHLGELYWRFFQLQAREYFLDRCLENKNMIQSTLLKSINTLELERSNFHNVFDELIETEIDPRAVVSLDLEQNIRFANILHKINTKTSNEYGQSLDLSEEDSELIDFVDNIDRQNTEFALFRLLQTFMMQNIATQRKPLGIETVEMADQYIERMKVHMMTSCSGIVPPNLREPVIIAAGWLAQYCIGQDPHRSIGYIDFLCEHVFLPMKTENSEQISHLFYLFFEAQMLVIKGQALMIVGDDIAARNIFNGLDNFSIEASSEILNSTLKPLVLAIRVNARHSLYNIELQYKSREEARNMLTPIQDALAELETAVGPPPSDRFDEDYNLQDQLRGIMSLWNFRGVAEVLEMKNTFSSPRMQREISLSRRGVFYADNEVREIEEFCGSDQEDLKKEILAALDEAVRAGDRGEQQTFHKRLVEIYEGIHDWYSAVEHIERGKMIENAGGTQTALEGGLFDGGYLDISPPADSLERGLMEGNCFLHARRYFSAAQTFYEVLGGDVGHVVGILSDESLFQGPAPDRVDLATQIGRLGDGEALQSVSGQMSVWRAQLKVKKSMRERRELAKNIAGLGRHAIKEPVVRQEDIAKVIFLALHVKLSLEQMDEEEIEASLGLLEEGMVHMGYH